MSKIPKHVSIIMDGNGRWARGRGLERLAGHKAGVESVRAATEFAAENGIGYLSLFAFSEENWNRPQSEISGLMELMIDAIINERTTLMDNNVRFRAVGDMSRLSKTLVDKISDIEASTSLNGGLVLIIFLSYSGRWDIINAVNKYIEKLRGSVASMDQPVTAECLENLLSTAGIPDPDLLIRTSGEQRISNYMLWQCAYTEFYFTDVLWPDFRKNDFKRALDTYADRERRYGKTGDQINKIN
ncbi:MAG: polyprenyl diphosphate synthase [Bacteroidales bacterium]|nr:polyprenyl diphosphate synthase [Bacteroidales bacterium]